MSEFVNTSGAQPVGDKILVQVEAVDKQMSSESLIQLPESVLQRELAKQSKGVFVEAGPAAWSGYPGTGKWAEPGDVVMFGRYGGEQFKGEDGKTYRVMLDSDITLTVTGDISA